MVPTATSEKYECRLNGSRACTFVKCTSMNGRPTASNASRNATLVCVKAAGLNKMNATWLAGASCLPADECHDADAYRSVGPTSRSRICDPELGDPGECERGSCAPMVSRVWPTTVYVCGD